MQPGREDADEQSGQKYQTHDSYLITGKKKSQYQHIKAVNSSQPIVAGEAPCGGAFFMDPGGAGEAAAVAAEDEDEEDDDDEEEGAERRRWPGSYWKSTSRLLLDEHKDAPPPHGHRKQGHR